MAEEIQLNHHMETSPGGKWVLVLSVTGKLGLSPALDLEKAVEEFMKDGNDHIVIDCSGLEYTNSRGAALLVKIQDELEAKGGSLQLLSVPKAIRDLLDVLGLLDIFHIVDSLDAAFASIG